MSFKYHNRYQIKNEMDFSNSINNSHWKTETNTNTTINNYNENPSNFINCNNDNNNQSLDNYIENEDNDEDNDENIDKFGITNSPKFSNSPTNIDEMIKNEMSSAVIDSFLNENQIKSVPMFILYLSEIWQELSKEANSPKYQDMGINLFSFNKYYNLPGLIGQRLFNIFDKDNNGFLSPKEFISGMCAVFCEEINSLIQFVFNFYDFDRDELITFDDLHAVLSYLPVINGFDDMIDIEEEIYSTIEDIFINKKEKIDYNTFYDLIIRKERYELFIPLISFFYDNKPFTNEEIIEFYSRYYNMGKINAQEGHYIIKDVIDLKEIETKEEINNDGNICNSSYNFKSSIKSKIFEKSNYYNSTISENNTRIQGFKKNFLNNNIINTEEDSKLSKENYKKYVLNSHGFAQMRKSMPLVIGNSNILNSNNDKKKLVKSNNLVDLNQTKLRFEFNNRLKTYKKKKSREGSVIYSFCQNVIKGTCMTFNNKLDNDTDNYERDSLQKSLAVQMDTDFNNIGEISWKKNYSNINQRIKFESELYKITKTGKMKKLYFKLYNQDLFFYKDKNSTTHKGMHNLSTFYLEIIPQNNSYMKNLILNNGNEMSIVKKGNIEYSVLKTVVNGIDYYCFLLISLKGQIHFYYTPDFDIYKKWIDSLKVILKYKNIYEQYIFREIIGKGKNCIVFYAYDRLNKRNVAIKKINKTLLTLEDLSLIQTEIDTLKVCQHPYVVKLYDIIETFNEVNIILEHCELGNLYFYLNKIKFHLTEKQIATYIHDISKAVYSMHNLGIIHRDLKLSNIALTNHNNKIEIRILDFGLSKILGPNQYCNEGYGTPGYAAPEVISRYNYNFEADVWSIGVITFFLFEGKLPFDYIRNGCIEKDIIENTLLDEVKIDPNKMQKYSKYATKFIKDLMNKNTFERPNIKEVLEHEWFQLFFKNEVKKRKINTYKNEFYENPEIEENYTCDDNIENSKQNRTNYLLYTSINNI